MLICSFLAVECKREIVIFCIKAPFISFTLNLSFKTKANECHLQSKTLIETLQTIKKAKRSVYNRIECRKNKSKKDWF